MAQNGKLEMTYMLKDDFGRPVYQDQLGGVWKDVSCGRSEPPELYSAYMNRIEGEVNSPIDSEFIILDEYVKNPRESDYMMLSRLKQDCDYYLGNGNQAIKHLWGNTVQEHIHEMKRIWNSLATDEKPEWLTMQDIESYEGKMTR